MAFPLGAPLTVAASPRVGPGCVLARWLTTVSRRPVSRGDSEFRDDPSPGVGG